MLLSTLSGFPPRTLQDLEGDHFHHHPTNLLCYSLPMDAWNVSLVARECLQAFTPLDNIQWWVVYFVGVYVCL